MIVVTVFLSILNQMEFQLVQNRKENCHHDYIPLNVKGNGNTVFSVHLITRLFMKVSMHAPNVLYNQLQMFFFPCWISSLFYHFLIANLSVYRYKYLFLYPLKVVIRRLEMNVAQ